MVWPEMLRTKTAKNTATNLLTKPKNHHEINLTAGSHHKLINTLIK
jgi:hypothetical protein